MIDPVANLFTIIDSETSGLFDFKLPADAEGQPRLAALSMIRLNSDYAVDSRDTVLIKPDGWVLGAEAAAVNGLTMERLNAEGVPVREVLEDYTAMIKSGRAIAAFNAQYDAKVMRGELRRAGMDDLFHETRNICLMRAMTDICQILKANPRTDDDWKFPKLAEALAHIGAVNEAPHTAGGDADGALLIFNWLRERDMLPAAGIHLAKKKPDGAAPKRSKAAKSKPVMATDEIPDPGDNGIMPVRRTGIIHISEMGIWPDGR